MVVIDKGDHLCLFLVTFSSRCHNNLCTSCILFLYTTPYTIADVLTEIPEPERGRGYPVISCSAFYGQNKSS